MLSKYYGFVCVNNTGQTVTYDSGGRLSLLVLPYRLLPSGLVRWGTLITDDLGFGAGDSAVDGGEDPSGEIDNSSDCFPSALVWLELTHDAGTAADGTYDVYYEGAQATGDLPSDQTGYDDAETNDLVFLDSLTWHSSGADDEVMKTTPIAI